MRRIFKTFLLLSIPAISFGQSRVVDSLKHLLQTGQPDSTRSLLLSELSRAYLYSKPDTALTLAQQGLALARSTKFAIGEIAGLIQTAEVFSNTGNNGKALELFLMALKKSESTNDKKYKSVVFGRLAFVYSNQGDYQKAKHYALQSKEIAFAINDERRIIISLINLGDCYEKLNQLDSARLCTNQAYALIVKQNDVDLMGFALNNLGNIYSKMGQDAVAMDNYRSSLLYYIPEDDEDGLCETYLGMATLFRRLGKTDSCLHYAELSLAYGKKGGFTPRVMNASNFLTGYYTSVHNVDSAFVYQSATIAAKDSLFSEEKQREIQSLSFDETMRQLEIQNAKDEARTQLKFNALLGSLATLLIVAFLLYRNSWQRKRANVLLKQQKQKVEFTLQELKSTQSQLVQSEKMASLGELTAGIAHEIQNPLNFVNNFSEVNKELANELQQELKSGKIDEAIAISNDIINNEEKINQHGKRADAIVKGMLQHSRSSTGVKELSDINALADEYLRLAYHGIRAKDNAFNATMQTDFDTAIGKINIIPQDMGRVLLNLYNNAFYALSAKVLATADSSYEPTVSVSTKKISDKVLISVKDNGNGVPQKVADKIFQPFFTTKPTGQGTGLGLSLSYDIIKAHGGELIVNSREGEYAEFIIQLPV